jgi:cytochrome oxidase assembly protein ShyY1
MLRLPDGSKVLLNRVYISSEKSEEIERDNGMQKFLKFSID